MNYSNVAFLKNISIAFVANIVALVSSAILTFLLPKFIGVLEYGYYQLYIFYVSYIGFLGIGWLDGVCLRYAGKFYDKIDKKLFLGQFKAFSFFELILSVIIFIVTILNFPGFEKEFVYAACCVCILIYMPRAILHQLLQATGRVDEYAKSLIFEKIIHILITLLGLTLGRGCFEWFIVSELFGRLCATCYIFYVCRDILSSKSYSFIKIIPEIKNNIVCGFALMISNVASMFVVGAVRQAIVMFWDVETFGKISLTLAVSNLLLIFINSISIVLFPMLKRINKEELTNLYPKIRTLLMIVVFSALLFYLPLRKLFSFWLPVYAESFKYMAILFPMIVFESKMALLINTYMKALRIERLLLLVNIVAVFLSFIIALITCKYLHNLDFAIVGIIVVLIFRCILAEFILKKYIPIKIILSNIIEIILAITFIISSWYFSEIKGLLLYMATYLIFIMYNLHIYKNKLLKRS